MQYKQQSARTGNRTSCYPLFFLSIKPYSEKRFALLGFMIAGMWNSVCCNYNKTILVEKFLER